MIPVLPRLLVLAFMLCAALAVPAAASRTQESTFQDDNKLVYAKEGSQAQTLDQLRDLGVDRIRVSVFWKVLAPDALESTKPAGFDPSDHRAYPPGAWDRYDRLLELATERGIGVNFNLTGPAPLWATGTPPSNRPDLDETWAPDPAEFEAFARAVASRYDGDPQPRVTYWSIWNEPNQAGWLTPQWEQVGGRWVEAAARTYRALADGAWRALADNGHGSETILVGETAPKGLKANRGPTRSIDALRFLRRVYCLDDNLQPLRGAGAQALGCPEGDPAGFVRDHPVLFVSSGWAHHPYELIFAPSRKPSSPDWVTTGNLSTLTTELRRVRQRYGLRTSRRGVPLYLTEFGYQTRPPDPTGVSPARQAAYINEAEFLAYEHPAVRTLAQFLLTDDAPLAGVDPDSAAAWGKTFQTGLVTLSGREKPALDAYRLPVHVPRPRFRRGSRVRVWGVVRPGSGRERVEIQFRRAGRRTWKRLATRTVRGPRHVLDTRLRLPGTGAVRLVWDEDNTPRLSRAEPVREVRAKRARRRAGRRG